MARDGASDDDEDAVAAEATFGTLRGDVLKDEAKRVAAEAEIADESLEQQIAALRQRAAQAGVSRKAEQLDAPSSSSRRPDQVMKAADDLFEEVRQLQQAGKQRGTSEPRSLASVPL